MSTEDHEANGCYGRKHQKIPHHKIILDDSEMKLI